MVFISGDTMITGGITQENAVYICVILAYLPAYAIDFADFPEFFWWPARGQCAFDPPAYRSLRSAKSGSGRKQNCERFCTVRPPPGVVCSRTIGTKIMQVVRENLVVVIAVGFIAGWLVGHFVKGIGFGILGDIVVGIGGAFVGVWLLSELNIHLGPEFIEATISATVGALLFLFAIGILRAAIERAQARGAMKWRWL